MNWPESTTNILIHSLFMVLFLSIFFFTVVTRVERDIITTQLNTAMTNIKTSFKSDKNIGHIFETDSGLANDLSYISAGSTGFTGSAGSTGGENNLNTSSTNRGETSVHNEKIFINAIIVLVVLTLVVIIVSFIIWYFYKVDIKKILLFNLIMICVIITVEISFLFGIVRNYVIVDEQKIKESMLNAMVEVNNLNLTK